MQLYLIRHGQSQNNALWVRTGSFKERVEDPLLTDIGEQQAQTTAEFITQSDNGNSAEIPDDPRDDPFNRTGFGFTHLYTSLMIRAIQTATPIAQATGLPLLAWEEIHERGGIFHEDPETGEYIGRPGPNRAFFESTFPHLQLPDTLGEAGWWNRPMETAPQTFERAIAFSRALLERHGDSNDRVAIVTHGGFTFALMTALLGLTPRHDALGESRRARVSVNNTSITRYEVDNETARLIYFNRLDHLPTEIIT